MKSKLRVGFGTNLLLFDTLVRSSFEGFAFLCSVLVLKKLALRFQQIRCPTKTKPSFGCTRFPALGDINMYLFRGLMGEWFFVLFVSVVIGQELN